MSTLIIIPCSGLKLIGGNLMPINLPFFDILNGTRNDLIHEFQPNLNLQELMPAYLRYGAGQVGNDGGRLYTNMNWTLALNLIRIGSLKVLIVSALFGLIEYDTSIPYYDLKMDKVKRLWIHENNLNVALNEYLTENPDIVSKRSFLSNHYFQALNYNIANEWIPYDRGANVAIEKINPLLGRL